MFQQGSSVRVRVGNATASAELYENAYESADEANTAMLDAGILTAEQVPDVNVPAGTGIHLTDVTTEQLMAAGLSGMGFQPSKQTVPAKKARLTSPGFFIC